MDDGLRCDDVAAKLGSFALGPITCAVQPGEQRLLVGPSGAGKSLLLQVVAGFHPTTAGTCHVAGRSVTHAPPALRRCAWVGQRAALFAHMTVRENIAFGLRAQQATEADIAVRVEQLAVLTSVQDFLERRPSALSVGQVQRVALARALAPGFTVLLLDEPFSALDRGARVAMVQLLDALCTELSVAVLHVTHDVDVMRRFALRAWAMVQGRIVQGGNLTDMMSAPADTALAEAFGPFGKD